MSRVKEILGSYWEGGSGDVKNRECPTSDFFEQIVFT